MAHGDATDTSAKSTLSTGDLFDWDSDTLPVAGATPVFNGSDTEYKNVPPVAAIADAVAITGGEVPTEAEHNLQVTKLNAVLAALRTKGIIAA